MRDFNADEWSVAKGEKTVALERVHYVQIEVSCSKPVTLFGVRGKKKVPFQSGTSFRFRGKVQNFEALTLQGTGQTEYGWRYLELPRQDGEPINHENPPAPPMPGNENMLLAIRRIFRDEMRRNRPPVMEPEDLPGAERYGIEDDDWDFEEDIHARLQKEAEAEGDPNDPPEPEPAHREPEPAPEPASPKKAPEPAE